MFHVQTAIHLYTGINHIYRKLNRKSEKTLIDLQSSVHTQITKKAKPNLFIQSYFDLLVCTKKISFDHELSPQIHFFFLPVEKAA